MERILRYLCITVLGSMIILMSSCTEGTEVDNTEFQKNISEGMTHKQIVQHYAENENLSEEEAEADIAVMQLRGLETGSEKYRIISLPVEEGSSLYRVSFIIISDEKEKDWKIKSVESAWVENLRNEKQLFLGTIRFWTRGERKLEYLINGDFYKKSNLEIQFHKSEKEDTGTINIAAETDRVLKSQGYLEIHKEAEL